MATATCEVRILPSHSYEDAMCISCKILNSMHVVEHLVTVRTMDTNAKQVAGGRVTQDTEHRIVCVVRVYRQRRSTPPTILIIM